MNSEIRSQILGIVGMSYKGEYNSNIQYKRGNVVSYDGCSYVALSTFTGQLPTNTTYWQLIARKPIYKTDYLTDDEMASIVAEIIEDSTNVFNKNVTSKTTAFNTNATNKTGDFNDNATSKTTTFNNNASSKTTDFNDNASSKTTTFNGNATDKTTAFDNNASSKTTIFNTNATSKTTDFDNNATSKTTTFNSNATSKTTDFNTNASNKVDAYNENATNKVNTFNNNVDSITERLEVLEEIVDQQPHVENTVASDNVVLEDTLKAPMEMELIPQTNQKNSLLPEGYTLVEYIETTGTQFIDTLVYPSNDIQIETKIEVTNTDQDTPVFGGHDANFTEDTLGYYCHLTPYNNKWYFGKNNQEGNAGVYDNVVGTIYEIIFNNVENGIVINGTTITTNQSFAGRLDSTLGISKRGGTRSKYGKFKYYNFKMYNISLNKYVRDFVPCYRNNDNVIGMYDLINDEFFTNAGSGTFNKGNDVNLQIPNPSYPQEIKCTTGEQTIVVSDGNDSETTFKLNLGKNLFDKDNVNVINGYTGYVIIAHDSHRSIYIPCKPNTTYTVQKINSGSNKRFAVYTTTVLPEAGVTISKTTGLHSDSDNLTIVTNSNDKYLLVWCYATNDEEITFEEVLASIQIEEGSVATTYAPYMEPIELYSIGDKSDGIVYDKDEDKFYIRKNTAKYKFTGNENWGRHTSGCFYDRNNHYRTFDGVVPSNDGNIPPILCTHFLAGSIQNVFRLNNIGISASPDNSSNPRISHPDITTVDDFISWLQSNDVSMVFATNNHVDTEITNTSLITQLRAIYNALSVNGDTHILSTANGSNLPFLIKAKALQDYVTVNDRRFTTLSNAVVALGANI